MTETQKDAYERIRDEVEKIRGNTPSVVMGVGVGEAGPEKIVAEGGLVAPVDTKYVISYDHSSGRAKPCGCVQRCGQQAAALEKFAVPVAEGFSNNVTSQLLEVRCADCNQRYLLAEWEDLATGLRFK